MLIVINPNIEVEWESLSNDFLDKLEWVLLQHSIGNHYIFMPRSAANFFEKKLHSLSRKSKEIISQLKSQSDDGVAIKKKILVSIEIISTTSPCLPRCIKNGDKTIWQLSLLDAVNWLSERTKLISEGLDDTALYEQAAKCYAIKEDLPINNIALSHEITGGCGGAPSIIDQKIKEKTSPILLILDSDKLSPSHTGHPSLLKCKKRQKDEVVYYFKELRARELENIIPLSFIEESILKLDEDNHRDSLVNGVDVLKKFNQTNGVHYLYLDIKNGTCFNRVITQGIAVSDFFSTVPAFEGCSCANKVCKGKISPPLGTNIITIVRDYLQNDPLRRNDKRVMPGLPLDWIEAGELVYSMGFANKTRTL